MRREEEFLRHAAAEIAALAPPAGGGGRARRAAPPDAGLPRRCGEDVARAPMPRWADDGAEGQIGDARRWLDGVATGPRAGSTARSRRWNAPWWS
jgi:hypothetical protein